MKHLVLVGAGHAHLTVIRHLDSFLAAGYGATVISHGRRHYYSGMGPGFLSGRYEVDDIRFDVEAMTTATGAAFVKGRVVLVDTAAKEVVLESGERHAYDLLSLNVGSEVADLPGHGEGMVPVVPAKPIEMLAGAREHILEKLARCPSELSRGICVIGGGPAGVEIAGNLSTLVAGAARDLGGPAPPVTLLAGSRLMKRFPDKARRLILSNFKRRSIRVVEGTRARSLAPEGVILDSGAVEPAGLVFLATGVRPPELIARSSLPADSSGGLLVDRYLRSVGHADIFGGGDCIAFRDQPLDKVGVHAVRQNPILLANLRATLSGEGLTPYKASNRYMLLINLGDGTAVFIRSGFVLGGPLGPLFMRLKDHIDRKFMHRFKGR